MKKPTVTIGIPVYKSEKNIAQIMLALVKQNQTYCSIKKIIVYCDGCKDATPKMARMIKSSKILVVDAKVNRGMAWGVDYMLTRNTSDIFVLLNDDIKIEAPTVIDELVRPFLKYKNVGLVNGRICPLPPTNFIGKCVVVNLSVYESISRVYKNGRSRLTVDGKIMALSKDFARSLRLNKSESANLDIFLYFENLKQGRAYYFTEKAVVYYRAPESIKDFRNQETRNRSSYQVMEKQYGEIVKREWKFPTMLYIKEMAKALLKHPVESLVFKLVMNSFISPDTDNFVHWVTAETTKNL